MHENERYFPKHTIERDIGLAEYALAASRLASEERALTWSSNTTLAISSVVGYASFRVGEYRDGLNSLGQSEFEFRIVLLATILIFSILSILHFSDLVRSLALAQRKIIVIRRMLGVSYGENYLVLPNWRLEGADQPFAITIFPGLFSTQSFPTHIVLIVSSLSIIFLLPSQPFQLHLPGPFSLELGISSSILSGLWYLSGLTLFRVRLFDRHEGLFLILCKFTAWMLRIRLVPDFEYILYRIRLDISEASRIHVDFQNVRQMAVLIEDRQFWSHRGVNWRGTTRALLGYIMRKRKGGGSSITQQFVRTNFIIRPQASIRRKIIEMLLAYWVEGMWSKEEILDGYLVTARFHSNVYGFHRMHRYLFGESAVYVSPWEAFILIERLANIRDFFLGDRVRALLLFCIEQGVVDRSDAEEALKFYNKFLGLQFFQREGQPSPSQILQEISGK